MKCCAAEGLSPSIFAVEKKTAEVVFALEGEKEVGFALFFHNFSTFLGRSGIYLEDLISIGTIGLVKAIGTYRLDKNIRLATYASRCIENEILMVLRKSNRLKSEVSFDEPLNTDWDGNELLLSDILGTEPDLVSKDLDADVEKQMLHTAIDKLNDREKYIVGLRYGLGADKEHTQKEVADMMGISQSYISRLEKKIIVKLRDELQKMA